MINQKKIKYIKQRDVSSCGPVAIINILKWLGYNVTYKFIHIARWACKWQDARECEGGGSTARDIEKALKYFSINKKRKICPTLKEIDEHIDSGGIVLLFYCLLNKKIASMLPLLPKNIFINSHFSLCIGRTKKTYIMINDGTKYTVGYRSRKTISNVIEYEPNGEKCWAWFITKPKKRGKKCQKKVK